MLIGIISDTHDDAVDLLKAIDIFNDKKVELVVHCGDWVSPFMGEFCKGLKCRLVSIWGNNEGDKHRFLNWQKEKGWDDIEFNNTSLELELDGKKIIAYHGDSKPLLAAAIDSQKYDAVFSGHTHKALAELHGKTLHVNPGSISGLADFQIVPEKTIAIYDTKTNQAEILNLR